MKITAKMFRSLATGIFFLVFAGFLIWFTTQPSVWKDFNVQFTEQPYSRTITVNGEGEVTSKPDMAVVNLSVVVQGRTVDDVTANGNERMSRVISALKGLGVSEDDIKTTDYRLNPEYVYPENGKATIVGYRLDQNVRVKVRDLTQVEEVLDQGVKEGANQVGQISFEIDDDSEQRDQAREEAFADAREKAEKMAAAAGVRLGRVVTFSESGGFYPQPMMYRAEAAADQAVSAPSIEPGSQETAINVSVTYEIES